MRVGVMGAMPQEIAATVALLDECCTQQHGGRDYTTGGFLNHQVVCVHARIGKVAAASAAVELIVRFGIERLIFTGLAGALSADLRVGDVVIADGLIQHDMDASPLFPPLEVPLTGVSRFAATPEIASALARAARRSLKEVGDDMRAAQVDQAADARRACAQVRGDIATGDQFVATGAARDRICSRVPGAVCVEMEGAAVAQVCHEYGIPFGVMRVISDRADGSAAADFFTALAGPTAALSARVIDRVLTEWANEPDR